MRTGVRVDPRPSHSHIVPDEQVRDVFHLQLDALRSALTPPADIRRTPAEIRRDEGALVQIEAAASIVPAMCRQIFRGVARGMLDLEPIVAAIRNRSWAVKEVGTQHSGYVDQLLGHVSQLVDSLGALGVPAHIHRVLVDEVVAVIGEQLVEGFSHTKKVSDEGRALMSLDVKTLQAGLRKLLAELPPMPYVENYIRALYLPSEQVRACDSRSTWHLGAYLGGSPVADSRVGARSSRVPDASPDGACDGGGGRGDTAQAKQF